MAASKPEGREVTTLNGAWRYAVDSPCYDFGEHLWWMRADYDDADWPLMDIPACWDLADPTLFGYEGYVWFRRQFDRVARSEGRACLHFLGANYRVDVWLNDVYLGAHDGGYTPFHFRIDEALDPSGRNALAVRVDNRPLPDRIPGTRRSWFNYGGLYRDVYVEQVPSCCIAGYTIDAIPEAVGVGGPAGVTTRLTIRNDREATLSGELRLSVAGETHRVAVKLAPRSEAVIDQAMSLPHVEYWSPDHPRLHTFTAELTDGESGVDRCDAQVGVRSLVTDGSRLLLNGDEIRIYGVNRHEEYPTTGRAHDEATLTADLLAIKASGANFIRASHYPQHPRLYDACDELGFLVMDEIPLWGWGRSSGFEDEPSPVESAFTQVEEMVASNRNRTCVVIWSVSNETGGGNPTVDDANIGLMRHVRRLDPTRLVTHVVLHSVWTRGQDRAMAEDDLICINEYEGILKPDLPIRQKGDIAAAVTRLEADLDALHQRFPTKPVLVTEFGGIALPGHHYDSPWSEEGCIAAVRAHWDAFARRDWISGALLWCWQDYRQDPHPVRVHPAGFYGVVTADRITKRAYLDAMTEVFEAQGENT